MVSTGSGAGIVWYISEDIVQYSSMESSIVTKRQLTGTVLVDT